MQMAALVGLQCNGRT